MHETTDSPAWRIGVDTGGTFTDLLLVDPTGAVCCVCKVLSTPDDPGRAVRRGIEVLLDRYSAGQAGQARPLDVGDLYEVVHGSTVATNALLENKADAAAFITTAGFEDLLKLARQDRPDLYALTPTRPDPPVPRQRVIGVRERTAYNGAVLTTLTQHEVDRVVAALRALEVKAAAVCLLHSYANDAHERRLAQAIRAALPGLHLTVSSELLPELREYERASTCVVNAVVGPTMSRYIGQLDAALGVGRLRIMASGGGTLPAAAVCARPVETVMSGPAGGVLGAWSMARAAGERGVIGFDMGGTSTDVALCDGGPTHTTQTSINALPIRLQVIDIHTVGAGGGSVAWIDAGGALRVGPQSAGADPGPACYGRQGPTPCVATVTDAHAVLGHLRGGRALGEAMRVDADAARQAIGVIADRLGLSVQATAEGVLRVADAAMARAIQRVSVQRGHDARGYTLVAFGGAGGLHACRLASVLGMTRVLVPVHGGLLSAYGMLAAPVRYALSHAVLRTFEADGERGYGDPLADDAVADAIGALVQKGHRALDADHIAAQSRTLNKMVDMRFAGQSYEITVAVGEGPGVIERFIEAHTRLYGYAPVGKPIEVVAARVEALGPAPLITPKPTGSEAPCGVQPRSDTSEQQTLNVIEVETTRPWQLLQREALAPGDHYAGPAVIEEYAATTVVPRGWSVEVMHDGQILLEYKEKTP